MILMFGNRSFAIAEKTTILCSSEVLVKVAQL